jgi:hypothetical protein
MAGVMGFGNKGWAMMRESYHPPKWLGFVESGKFTPQPFHVRSVRRVVVVDGPTVDGIKVVQTKANILILLWRHIGIKCAPKDSDFLGNVVAGMVQKNEFAERWIDVSSLFARVSERYKTSLGDSI